MNLEKVLNPNQAPRHESVWVSGVIAPMYHSGNT